MVLNIMCVVLCVLYVIHRYIYIYRERENTLPT